MTETTRIGAEVSRTFHTRLTTLAGRLTSETGKRVDVADLIRDALTRLMIEHGVRPDGDEEPANA